MSTTSGGEGVSGGNREAPEEIVDLLYRAILRRPPDELGRAAYSRLLRAGESELDCIMRLVSSAEFGARKLVLASDLLFRAMNDYDSKADQEILKYTTADVMSMTEQLQRRSVDYAVFDKECRSEGKKSRRRAHLSSFMKSQKEYLRIHQERFYELACAVKTILEVHSSDALILDFGLSIYSFVMRTLFPSAKIAIADRPQMLLPKEEFHGIYTVDLEDDRLGEIELGGKFDIIVFSDVIEYLRKHPVKVISFLLKHLTQDGYVVLTTPNPFSRNKLRQISQRKSPLMPYPMEYTPAHGPNTHIREYSMKEMLAMIDEAGGRTRAYFFSACWDDPATRRAIPPDELSNMFFVFQSKESHPG